MNAKITKDVRAQRVLIIEKPTKGEETIEEMVRRMERELDNEVREFDTNGIVVDSLIKKSRSDDLNDKRRGIRSNRTAAAAAD